MPLLSYDMSIPEALGWAGVIFYVSSYLLLSTGRLRATDYTFHLLNVLGAAGLIIDSLHEGDNPNLVVNCIWLLIGMWAIGKRWYSQSKRRSRNEI
jgi:hypothetical protein